LDTSLDKQVGDDDDDNEDNDGGGGGGGEDDDDGGGGEDDLDYHDEWHEDRSICAVKSILV